ncbi:MAG: tetratricopeptide repeat protein [Saprospiraceae bacterium]|nr:tetratricopeptide repeat protein [Saprospiraceae bacterium]
MKKLPVYLVLVFSALFFAACEQNNLTKKIATLEQTYAATGSRGAADSLFQLYSEAVQKNPDDHANNYNYLVKGAEISFFVKEDGPLAVKWAGDALKEHGKGQNYTDLAGLFARIWIARDYHKPVAARFKPDEIDFVQAFLQNNQSWIDSSLLRLDRAMSAPNGVISDKAKAEAFIETAEGYAILVQQSNPDKYVDLLMKAAGVAKTIGNARQAIQLYYAVESKMPQHPKAPTALFMKGFVYENDVNDLEKAKATYEEFLKRYPNDPDYADDAQNALKLLGKSPEEIVREFEQKNAGQQVQ